MGFILDGVKWGVYFALMIVSFFLTLAIADGAATKVKEVANRDEEEGSLWARLKSLKPGSKPESDDQKAAKLLESLSSEQLEAIVAQVAGDDGDPSLITS